MNIINAAKKTTRVIITVSIICFKAEDLSNEDNSLTNLNDLNDEYLKLSQKVNVSLSNPFHFLPATHCSRGG